MLLKQGIPDFDVPVATAFSTLYRVDAIEANNTNRLVTLYEHFQYPLSGRCY